MEEEIIELKDNLDKSMKREDEWKTSLKELENELVSRRTELGKLTMLYEVDKEEKVFVIGSNGANLHIFPYIKKG